MCLSDELYLYSIMPLPALSTNEPRAKHANRSFALRPAPCKTRMRAPAATDVRSCAAVLLRLLHYFLLCSLFIALFALFLAPWFPPYEKHQGQMPWRVAPQVRLELTTLRLTAECSAIELLRIIRGLWRDSFACPAACLSASGALAHAPASCASASARSASASPLASPGFRSPPRSPLCLGAGKTFVPPAPLDPGNFLLSQAVPSSVPSAFGGLTSVFGMGTGGALQLSSPETFPGKLLSLPTPRTFKTAQQLS